MPKSTLSGRVLFSKKSGPAKYLSDEEELELLNFICGCAFVGYDNFSSAFYAPQ